MTYNLKRVMVFYLCTKNNKKRLNGSKDIINLKSQVIFEILPNFAPIFRGEGVEIEKNCPHQSKSTFQELFKYEIRFSKSLAVVSDIGI